MSGGNHLEPDQVNIVLEKLGYVESAEEWQRLRAIRNGFAHDYPDDPAKRAALVNMAVAGVAWMKGITERIGAVAVLRAG